MKVNYYKRLSSDERLYFRYGGIKWFYSMDEVFITNELVDYDGYFSETEYIKQYTEYEKKEYDIDESLIETLVTTKDEIIKEMITELIKDDNRTEN